MSSVDKMTEILRRVAKFSWQKQIDSIYLWHTIIELFFFFFSELALFVFDENKRTKDFRKKTISCEICVFNNEIMVKFESCVSYKFLYPVRLAK